MADRQGDFSQIGKMFYKSNKFSIHSVKVTAQSKDQYSKYFRKIKKYFRFTEYFIASIIHWENCACEFIWDFESRLSYRLGFSFYLKYI